MKRLTKVLSCAAAMALCMGIGVSASAFSDMPDGEMGEALQRAVDVGLMNGVTDDLIKPNDNITRAQMATIIVRAFGATDTSSTKFNDVAADAWYAQDVLKAVAMGAFEGDDDNNFNPENNITFQETYIVLSRMFGFEPYELRYSDGTTALVGDCDESVLSSFSDRDKVAAWAKNYAKYIVGNGGWTGIDGMLKPTDAITRGEFAMVMDKIVDSYVDDQAAADALKGKEISGAVLVRKGGITVDGLNTDGNFIITQGVDESGIKVTNSTVNGVTLVLGGIDKTPVVGSNGALIADEAYVSLSGKFYDLRSGDYVFINAAGISCKHYNGGDGSNIFMGFVMGG
ncbi:MAG: S-layer homology domain-containing protein [Candidatus Ornithomonoglobus sp.]